MGSGRPFARIRHVGQRIGKGFEKTVLRQVGVTEARDVRAKQCHGNVERFATGPISFDGSENEGPFGRSQPFGKVTEDVLQDVGNGSSVPATHQETSQPVAIVADHVCDGSVLVIRDEPPETLQIMLAEGHELVLVSSVELDQVGHGAYSTKRGEREHPCQEGGANLEIHQAALVFGRNAGKRLGQSRSDDSHPVAAKCTAPTDGRMNETIAGAAGSGTALQYAAVEGYPLESSYGRSTDTLGDVDARRRLQEGYTVVGRNQPALLARNGQARFDFGAERDENGVITESFDERTGGDLTVPATRSEL